MRRLRYTAIGLAAIAAGILAGCSAPDRTAVGVNAQGLPVIDNCGTWIAAVEATDADTGRTIWSTEGAENADGGVATQGEVVLGKVPPTWVELAPLDIEPRPQRWRFSVDATTDVTIEVVDADLVPGQVHRAGGDTQSASEWEDTKCSTLPISRTVGRVILGGLVAVGAVAVIVILSRRRRSGDNPEFVHPEPETE